MTKVKYHLYDVDQERITQIIDYLKFKTGKDLSPREIFALVYLADRHHLRKYGAPMIGVYSFRMPTYFAVDESLPPINSWIAEFFGMHIDEKEKFLIECDLIR